MNYLGYVIIDDLVDVSELPRTPVVGEIIYNKITTNNLFQVTELVENAVGSLSAFRMELIEGPPNSGWNTQIWHWTSPFQAGLVPIFMEDMYKI